jgi:hypothetical protein
MGSKFLIGGVDLSALQDGSTPINVATVTVQNLGPNLPVKTDAGKQLTTGLIQLSDCAFVPLTNPATADLDMGDNALTDVKDMLLAANASPTTPPVGQLTVYEASDKLRYKDSNAITYQVATTADLSQTAGEIHSATQPVAPAGNRDGYINTTANGGTMNYIAATNTLYSSRGDFGIASLYSTNGGATWASTVFDVPPTGVPQIMYGYNGTTYAALSYTPGDPAYTSADGQNFTAGAVPAKAGANYDILWVQRLGLYVTTCYDAITWTDCIMTSPDGITWTPHTTPNFANIPLGGHVVDDGTTLVATGGTTAASSIIWSTDGITWTVATGAPAAPLACLAYSPERKEWMAQDPSLGTVYSSSDGRTWAAVGAGGVIAALFCTWVPSAGRYYISQPDNSTNGYSMRLYSAADPRDQFIGSYLDGAHSDNGGYSGVAYLPTYDRFVIGSAQQGIVYSVARPTSIKAMGDAIRVRNFPVSCGMISTYSAVTVDNTVTETLIVPTGSYVGSMTLYPSQALGASFSLCIDYRMTSAAGDTLTFVLKCNGSAMLTRVLTIPISAAYPQKIIFGVTVQAANAIISCDDYNSGVTTYANPAYDPLDTNDWTVTAQWGANVNQLSMDKANGTIIFLNGA